MGQRRLHAFVLSRSESGAFDGADAGMVAGGIRAGADHFCFFSLEAAAYDRSDKHPRGGLAVVVPGDQRLACSLSRYAADQHQSYGTAESGCAPSPRPTVLAAEGPPRLGLDSLAQSLSGPVFAPAQNLLALELRVAGLRQKAPGA